MGNKVGMWQLLKRIFMAIAKKVWYHAKDNCFLYSEKCIFFYSSYFSLVTSIHSHPKKFGFRLPKTPPKIRYETQDPYPKSNIFGYETQFFFHFLNYLMFFFLNILFSDEFYSKSFILSRIHLILKKNERIYCSLRIHLKIEYLKKKH